MSQLAAVVDWKGSGKELVKALALGTAAAFARGAFVAGTSIALNLGLSIAFFLMAGLAGGGHGTIVLLPLALVPFVPFVVLALVLAQKQAVMRVVAGALESQAPTVARVGEHYLGGFLRDRYGDLRTTRVGQGFDTSWRAYVGTRGDAPWAVRQILVVLASRVPLGELVDEAAARGVPTDDVPREVFAGALARIATDRLWPSWWTPIGLFAANVAWLPVALWLLRLWAAR
jgi:hypothetical protein